ncbi:hypothetical protein GCM10009715_37570 [Paeniglutamicibacter psychrophenolicus]
MVSSTEMAVPLTAEIEPLEARSTFTDCSTREGVPTTFGALVHDAVNAKAATARSAPAARTGPGLDIRRAACFLAGRVLATCSPS